MGPDNSLNVRNPKAETVELKLNEDWRPVAFSESGEVEAGQVVFAGYGLVAEGDGPHAEYDSYAHLDVEGKWVLMFRYLPEDISAEYRQHLARFQPLRYKAVMARERGARGVLVAHGPTSRVDDQLVELSFDASISVIAKYESARCRCASLS